MRTQCCRGFTLMELLIAVALLAILVTGVIPGFAALLERERITGAEHQFIAALNHTKQLAITHNRDATLCPSADGTRCLPRGRWHEGWIAFLDLDEDRERDAGEPILLENDGLEHVTLTSSKWRRRITFQSTGTAGGSNATFTLCHGDLKRAVILSRLGRTRVSEAGPGGRELECLRER